MKKHLSVLLAVLMLFPAIFAASAGAADGDNEQDSLTVAEKTDELCSFDRINDAIQFVRSQMIARIEDFQFEYTGSTKLTAERIFAYSGSAANEGDYLRFNLADFLMEQNETVFSCSVRYHTTLLQEQQISDKVTELLSEFDFSSMTEYQKAIFVYDLICDRVAYSETTTDSVVYTAFGALCNGNAKCQGFALAYYRLARAVSLDCRIIAGSLTEDDEGIVSHAWNAVKIGKSWYYLDTTNGSQFDKKPDRYVCFMMPLDLGVYQLNINYDEQEEVQEEGQSEEHLDDTLQLTSAEIKDYCFNQPLTGLCGTDTVWILDPLSKLLVIDGSGAMIDFSLDDIRWRNYAEIIFNAQIGTEISSICEDCFAGCSLTVHCVADSAAYAYMTYHTNDAVQLHLLTVVDEQSATCQQIGYSAGLFCETCDKYFMGHESQVILEHMDDENSDGFCDMCGLEMSFSEQGVCGEAIHWYFYENDGRLELMGSGKMYDYSTASPAPWKTAYARKVKSITVQSGITSIGDYAFYVCSQVSDVTLPEGLISIGAKAFSGATGLVSCNFPSSLSEIGEYAFYNCKKLSTASLHNGISVINPSTFEGCIALELDSFPESVTEIGNNAFYNCKKLTVDSLPSQLTEIGYKAFGGTAITDILIPPTLIKVNGGSGVRCGPFAQSQLETIQFAEGTISVPDNICASTVNLNNVVFVEPELIKKIGAYSFLGCSGIDTINLPDTVTEIGNNAFYNCNNLKLEALPSQLNSVGFKAFGKTAITDILIPATLTKAGTTSGDYYGPFAESQLETIRFAAGMNMVPDNICAKAVNLKSIVFVKPEAIEKIGAQSFWDCAAITTINLPDSVTEIGKNAFYNCKNLKLEALPSQLSSVGFKAFGKTAITDILIPATLTKTGSTSGDCYGPFAESQLETIRFAAGTNLVPDNICAKANNLQAVEFITPATVTEIGVLSFYQCTKLSSIIIPECISSIGRSAFEQCTSLASVLISSCDTFVDTSSFKRCSDSLIIHCPVGSQAEEYAIGQAITCHTDYELNEVSLLYCSGEENVVAAAYCNECGYVITKNSLIDAQGHSVVADQEVPATCIKTGLTAGTHCSICQTVLKEQAIIPAKGHTSVDTVAIAPTCTQNGKTAGTKCNVCGTILVQPETIPKTGHTAIVDTAIPPTCTQNGLTEGSHCSVCRKTLTVRESIPATGHQDTLQEGEREDGICDVCGEKIQENLFQRIIHRIGVFFEGLSRFIKNLFKKWKR